MNFVLNTYNVTILKTKMTLLYMTNESHHVLLH